VRADQLGREVAPDLEQLPLELVLGLLESAGLQLLAHALSLDEPSEQAIRIPGSTRGQNQIRTLTARGALHPAPATLHARRSDEVRPMQPLFANGPRKARASAYAPT
jgi:hypothetical protein